MFLFDLIKCIEKELSNLAALGIVKKFRTGIY
jgi:hypothetical protein